MKWKLPLAGGLVLLLLVGAWWSQSGAPQWHARHLMPVMKAYMRATAAGDSVGVHRVVAAAQPVNWSRAVHRSAPGYAAEASRTLRAMSMRERGDTVEVSFALGRAVPDPMCDARPLQHVYAGFVQQAGGWRIVYAATDIC